MRRTVALAAPIAILCGCATKPSLDLNAPPRYFEVSVTTSTYAPTDTFPDWQQRLQPMSKASLEGASCSLSNDRGAWQLASPGKVSIEIGGVLRIECRKDGFHAAKIAIACLEPPNPKATGALVGANVALAAAAPVIVVAAPTVGAGVLAITGVTALGAGVGYGATPGKERQPCVYAPGDSISYDLNLGPGR
jgi:hypothetical protein